MQTLSVALKGLAQLHSLGQPHKGGHIGTFIIIRLPLPGFNAAVTAPLSERLSFNLLNHRTTRIEIRGADVEPEAPVLHVGAMSCQHQERGWVGRGRGKGEREDEREPKREGATVVMHVMA